MRRLVVPVLLLMIAGGGGCAGRLDTVSEPAAASPASATATYPPYVPADVEPFDMTNIRGLPPAPELGVAYPFELYAHCGIELVQFAGATWRAEQPYHGALPGYIAGTLELLDAETARFVIDQDHFASEVEVIIYRKTSDDVPTCK
ncbi:MAG: hypothetical protein IRY85_00190 [Micromonosporaceae bacterium]|nr:hypothetical protein [Micromonosporaceae bacterium]